MFVKCMFSGVPSKILPWEKDTSVCGVQAEFCQQPVQCVAVVQETVAQVTFIICKYLKLQENELIE